jgi:PAS domain-containing protein
MKASESRIQTDVIVDLLGISEARLFQIKKRHPFEIPARLAELVATPVMQKRRALAHTLVEGPLPAIAVTCERRILACNSTASRLLWRSDEELLGRPIGDVVRRADAEEHELASDYEAAFAAAFAEGKADVEERSDDADGSEAVIEGESSHELPRSRPLQVCVLRSAWLEPQPADEFVRFSSSRPGHPDAIDASPRQREILTELQAKHPGRSWSVVPLKSHHPKLGSDFTPCEMTFADVQVSAKTSGPNSAIRVYHFKHEALRVGMTQEILELEYEVLDIAKDTDEKFAAKLLTWLRKGFDACAERITKHFACESASIFVFRLRGDEPTRREADGNPQVLLPEGKYGIPDELSDFEAFPVASGMGLISDFILDRDSGVTRWINFDAGTDEGRRNRAAARSPNFENMAVNARLGDARNCLLAKLAVPRRSPGAPSQIYGVLRMVNCFEPRELCYQPLVREPEWKGELEDLVTHLAIMYQQWLRIARRTVIARAAGRLRDQSTFLTYVQWLSNVLRRLLDFQHLAIWVAADEGTALRYLGGGDVAPSAKTIAMAASMAGLAFELDEAIDVCDARDRYPTRSLASEDEVLKLGLTSGFQVPLHSRRTRKWGVLSLYNTSVAELEATLYREETLQFCTTLAQLIAAKHDLETMTLDVLSLNRRVEALEAERKAPPKADPIPE